ncbi:D-alanine--D-alanine ligase family protein [Pasteuria penetrans]|uniref:D-alanine--D-alanine ligase family protein n=1 Tax=Pasteuria penetrans TaxID=86005 RepID=UPI000FB31834|nr:D-alanine--D-alanine ligase family protein [Pasteuria penetrans]
MRNPLRVAVLFGGRSPEHEVSCVSASSVVEVMDQERFAAIPIWIDKQGNWHDGETALRVLRPSPNHGDGGGTVKGSSSAGTILLDQKVDVVFPALHGPNGEDGTVQGLCTVLDIPCVGAGVLSSAICMDKDFTKRICAENCIPQAPYVVYRWSDLFPGVLDRQFLQTCRQEHTTRWAKVYADIEDRLSYPVFVKPATGGSSLGVSRAANRELLIEAMCRAFRYDTKVLVEEAVPARELFVALLGNEYQEPRISAIAEVVAFNEFYDYEAKLQEEKHRLHAPADISRLVEQEVQAIALRAYRSLGITGTARMDFFLHTKTGAVLLSEINTLPGFTSCSIYPELWAVQGLAFGRCVEELIELAIQSHTNRKMFMEQWDATMSGE